MLDGWVTCDFYVLFKGILVISGKREGDNDRLCAMDI